MAKNSNKDELAFNKFAGAIFGSLLFATSSKAVIDGIYAPAPLPHGPEAGSHATKDGHKAKQVADISGLLAKADIKKGQAISKKCVSCHTFKKGGKKKTGPNLYSVINKDIASAKGFKYSSALAKLDGNWTYDQLNCFLANPKKCVKNSKMQFAGVKDPQQRANLVGYLRSLSAKPAPLPKVMKKSASKKDGNKGHGKAHKMATKSGTESQLVTLLAKGNLKRGKRVAKKCVSCHTFKKGGKKKTGPNLWDVVGRKLGAVKDFKYSSGLKKKGGSWNYAELDSFLAKPKAFIKRTKMAFAGVKSAEQRADLIVYLRTQSDKPAPLPKK